MNYGLEESRILVLSIAGGLLSTAFGKGKPKMSYYDYIPKITGYGGGGGGSGVSNSIFTISASDSGGGHEPWQVMLATMLAELMDIIRQGINGLFSDDRESGDNQGKRTSRKVFVFI